MSIYEWLSIALICVAGATTPGPSVLVIIYINNTRGFLSGIIASLAHGLGIFIYALISIYTISLIDKNLPSIIPFIQLMGAIFLIYFKDFRNCCVCGTQLGCILKQSWLPKFI